MFMELGIKLDSLIENIKIWNRGKPLYKIYCYNLIKKDINEYSGVIESLYKCKYLYKWQYKKLIKLKG